MKKIYLMGLLAISNIANSATITVDTNTITPSDGVCDLADAIESANTDTSIDGCEAGSGGDSIILGVNTLITSALPNITSTISMSRPASIPIVQGVAGYTGRIFTITSSGSLSLSGVAVRNGNVLSDNDGGCILNSGSLTINNASTISDCSASRNGGGIYSTGTLSLFNVVISNNEAGVQGGGLYVSNGGNAVSFNTVNVNGNFAQSGGGGMYVNGGGFDVNRSGFTNNNTNSVFGGGLAASAPMNIFRSSFVGNTSGMYTQTTASISNSTFSGNDTYGMRHSLTGTLVFENNTVKNNTAEGLSALQTAATTLLISNNAFDENGTNCSGISTATGVNNISSDSSCNSIASFSSTAEINLNSLSGSGVTLYHHPNTGSSLIDAGNNSVCSNARVDDNDQRLLPRPETGGAFCDVGSIENVAGIVFNNSIDLIKTGLFNDENNDGFAQPSETITYYFEVENTGDQTLTNITISDPLVAVPGTIPTLASGITDNSTFEATYVLTQTDLNLANVLNEATVNGTDPSNATVTDQSEHFIILPFENSIDLIKTGLFNDENNDGFAQVGETITYSFVVENTGSQSLDRIYIDDPLITVLGMTYLNAGEIDNSTFSGSYVLSQTDIDAGQVSNLATVFGMAPNKTEHSSQSNNGVPLVITLNAGNSIDLIKDGVFNDENNDGFAQVGETISYSFRVENTGSQVLSNVSINDPLAPVTGNLASIAPSAVDTNTFFANYTLSQADIDAEQVSNTATVSGTTPNNEIVTDQSNNGQPFIVPLTIGNSIDLIKGGSFNDENNDGFAQVGETISYSFRVENTGSQVLSNVSINDPLAPVTGNLASIAPSAVDTNTFFANYTLSQADIDAEQVSNTATVSGTTPSNATVTDQSNNGQPFIVPLTIGNSIDLLKAGVFNDENNDGIAQAGETVGFTFTVENTGSQVLSNVSINDPLAPVTGNLTTLAPDEVDTNTFTAIYTLIQTDIDAGEVTNIATASGTTPSNATVTDQSNNGVLLVVNLPGQASIDLIKGGVFNDENNDGFAQAGETVSYSFDVENTGALTLTNVSISDPLTPVLGSLTSMGSGVIDSSTFTASYTLVQNDIDAGFVDNTATVTGTDPSNNQVSALSNNGLPFRVLLPSNNSIDLIKSGVFNDENNDGFAQAGETILYSFVVENTGSETLTNVSINDPLTPVSGSLATMPAGAVDTTTFTATYMLTQTDVDAGQVSNIATVNATTNINTTVTDESNDGVSYVIQLDVFNSIALIKDGVFDDLNNDGFAQTGETITYSFTVLNTGDQTLSNITINDPIVAVPGSIATLAPGDEDSTYFSAVYSITNNDIVDGVVRNIATVSGTTPSNTTVTDQSNNGVSFDMPLFIPPESPQDVVAVSADNKIALLTLVLIMMFIMRKKLIKTA